MLDSRKEAQEEHDCFKRAPSVTQAAQARGGVENREARGGWENVERLIVRQTARQEEALRQMRTEIEKLDQRISRQRGILLDSDSDEGKVRLQKKPEREFCGTRKRPTDMLTCKGGQGQDLEWLTTSHRHHSGGQAGDKDPVWLSTADEELLDRTSERNSHTPRFADEAGSLGSAMQSSGHATPRHDHAERHHAGIRPYTRSDGNVYVMSDDGEGSVSGTAMLKIPPVQSQAYRKGAAARRKSLHTLDMRAVFSTHSSSHPQQPQSASSSHSQQHQHQPPTATQADRLAERLKFMGAQLDANITASGAAGESLGADTLVPLARHISDAQGRRGKEESPGGSDLSHTNTPQAWFAAAMNEIDLEIGKGKAQVQARATGGNSPSSPLSAPPQRRLVLRNDIAWLARSPGEVLRRKKDDTHTQDGVSRLIARATSPVAEVSYREKSQDGVSRAIARDTSPNADYHFEQSGRFVHRLLDGTNQGTPG